jgi:putative oxidoreductase
MAVLFSENADAIASAVLSGDLVRELMNHFSHRNLRQPILRHACPLCRRKERERSLGIVAGFPAAKVRLDVRLPSFKKADVAKGATDHAGGTDEHRSGEAVDGAERTSSRGDPMKMMDPGPGDTPASVGLLILRLGVAGYMITHGWAKVKMLVEGQFEMFGDPIGIGPVPSLALVALAEFLCAILVLLGFATRIAAIPVVITMAVAAFVAHGADPWTMTEAAMRFFSGASPSWASKQPALTFLFVFLALVFTGAGRFSLDALITSRSRGARRG